ncbi:MAG: flagellar biosynthetic protein FliO [Steroidobacteraceae bacterium]
MSASAAFAAAAPTPFAAPAVADPVSTSGLAGAGEVTVALVLVLLVIFACAWCVKRLRAIGRPQGRVLAIVDDVSVGQKERVVLLACGGERLLVGVAPGAVRLLHVVPPSAFASVGEPGAEAPAARTTAAPAGIDFRAILRRNLGLPR